MVVQGFAPLNWDNLRLLLYRREPPYFLFVSQELSWIGFSLASATQEYDNDAHVSNIKQGIAMVRIMRDYAPDEWYVSDTVDGIERSWLSQAKTVELMCRGDHD